ncbi:MAG: phytanoyl-CoA dioxygenase family protein [bacterium]|nr:phytanoyl-CoA dioxygenase family protein [bacterium]MDE0289081.1 phytanoyl-CoA dioxygenase family protein [bacterium]MDE0438173.1 phytanoyl-CoA dioxygenase family protein [bacterium]
MAGLTVGQLERFDEDGYLVVEDVLTSQELAAIEDEYLEILDRVAAGLVAQGRIPPLRGITFSERYVEAMQHVDDMYAIYQHLDICLPMVRELDLSHTMNAGAAVFDLLTNRRLLDIAESVIGPEIYSNPVQHTRIKPPAHCLPDAVTDSNIAATTWHQDAGVINPEADGTHMLTVWLAVTDATIENGCLIAERASHREDLTMHCPGTAASATTYIPEAIIDFDRVVPLEVGAGGLVLLHKLTEHGSLDNRSDDIRWSFDLRYQPIGQPTGRSVFPGFIARSEAHPEQVLTDPDEWASLWWQARDRIVGGQVPWQFNARWDVNAGLPVCA